MLVESRTSSVTVDILRRWFASTEMIIPVWLPIAAVSVFHYLTPHQYHWIHDILRRVYYLPIIIAAVRSGLIDGLMSAVIVTLAYIPHAFMAEHHFDPARGLEKALEIALYLVVAGVAGYLSDLERRRRVQLQKALEEQKYLTEQLVRAGRLSALGEVVAGIAHEIKNPLHALKGTAEIVDPIVPKSAEERRMWEIHKEELDRLGRVAERFLSFARPAPVDPMPLDLRQVARRLNELIAADARKKAVELTVELPDNPVMVHGELDQLAQVNLNIALNALKAIGESGGKVVVRVGTRVHHDTEMACIEIENDGPAIPEGQLEHLFDPFYSGTSGTGLGLSISSRIAEQHGGFIEAANEGLGVRMTLYLPGIQSVD